MTRLACMIITALAALTAAATSAAQQAEPPVDAAIEQSEIAAPEGVSPEEVANNKAAVLRGLDKLTGAIVEFEAAAGADSSFERLRIAVDVCQQRGQEQAVFLKIFDQGRPEGLDLVFSGWMFASSPALSALDHPRYDVWLQSCKTS